MAANVRRGVAKPRAGVDPFQGVQAPQWLVDLRAQRQAEGYRQHKDGLSDLIVKVYEKSAGQFGHIRVEIQVCQEGLF
ncbi:hypothetical protein AB4Z34_35555 [Ensifer sp. 2YAB10]|uniref:hypothetical protein n=1 Tax=Ensifer sp. 2YAB10 TaxID=3233021 RepID=UPI003F8FBBBE